MRPLFTEGHRQRIVKYEEDHKLLADLKTLPGEIDVLFFEIQTTFITLLCSMLQFLIASLRSCAKVMFSHVFCPSTLGGGGGGSKNLSQNVVGSPFLP